MDRSGSALPEELERMVAGPELAGLLASVDRSGLDADELLRLARARSRLIAHQEAQLLADLHTVARVVPEDGPRPDRRDTGKYPWAEVEVAFALRWSYAHAADRLIFSDELVDRLPQVFTALDAGDIDVVKARIFCGLLGGLDEPVARAVADRVIGQAPRLTSAELRARLRRLVLAADPLAFRKQARHDVRDRRVAAFLNDNHLAAVSGYELAPHRAAAAMERLTAIARAAKAAGDPRKVDQLRADAFLDLLVGEGIATGGPITDGGLGDPDPSPGPDPGSNESPEVPWPTAPANPQDIAHTIDDPVRAVVPWPPPNIPAPRTSTPEPSAPGILPGPRRGVIDLQVPLTTLMSLSELPGELDGFGPVIADIARQVAESGRDTSTWRFSVYNRLGELAHHGVTNARPVSGHRSRTSTRPHAPPSRKPPAEIAAFVRARDRVCVAPGCRRAARQCDLDHTEDWARGGPTDTGNLGLLCRRHHIFKHESGCELLQLSPGVFGWTTPAGRQYVTTPDRPLL